MDYNFLDGIRVRALAGVMDPDGEYQLRDIFRWYSREFRTELHKVEELPLEFVLLHWFECQYQDLEPEEQVALARELLETPEERATRILAEKQDEDAFLQKAKEMNEKRRAKKDPARLALERHLAKALQKDRPEPSIRNPAPPAPEEVVVKYMPTGDMDAELDKPNGPLPGSNRKPK